MRVFLQLKRDAAGNSKGFGFVRMKDYDAQLRVLAKCHHEIDGRRCEVKIPLSKVSLILFGYRWGREWFGGCLDMIGKRRNMECFTRGT